jgi:hypothetical protein
MAWLSLALGAAGLLSGAASAKSQARATERAADTQAQAATQAAQIQAGSAREALDLERAIYGDQRALHAPTARLGAGAFARQAVMAGVSPEEAVQYFRGVDQAYSAPPAGAGSALAPSGGGTDWDAYVRDNADVQRVQDIIDGRWAGDEQYLNFLRGFQQDGAGRSLGEYHYDVAGRQFGRALPTRQAAAAPAATPEAPTGYAQAAEDALRGYSATSWMTDDPGYAFRRDEGAKALERSAIAGGRAFGGAYDKALTRYGQDYASNEYQSAFNRLGVISGAGQTATGALSTAAQNYGQNAGGYMTAAGNARAQGVANAGNARASGYQAQGQAWGDFWGNAVPGAVGTVAGAFAGKKGWS